MKNAGLCGRGEADVKTERVARTTKKMENIFTIAAEGMFVGIRVCNLMNECLLSV